MMLACGGALALGIATFGAKADEWNKKTVLTINEPIQVRDTLLEPGQYVFKLLNSSSDRHVVQIFNADQSHLINTILAVPKERMDPTGRSEFVFYETPAGTARALRAWYYPGDLVGQEFPYPKHLHQVAQTAHSSAKMTVTTTAMATEQPAAPVPEQPPAQVEEQPTPQPEMAQPPAEQPPAAEPTPDTSANREQPQELPKTASPYPLIGLSGLVMIGLSGVLRLKRSA
jgi:LPXTG-motif cell wall-anchored protein